MSDELRRKLLGEFLKARRKALATETSRVRREDIAQRAGISLTWYSWLEQGRAMRVTAPVIQGLASALALSSFELRLLQHLAQTAEAPVLERTAVHPLVVALLDTMEPRPAYVVDPLRRLLAWNRAINAVYADVDALPPDERNLLKILFTHPVVRSRLLNWEQSARRALQTFRASRFSWRPPAEFDGLVRELHERSREFRVWWEESEDLRLSDVSQDRVDHPEVGLLVLNNVPLVVAQTPHHYLLTTVPEPSTDTARKLERLAALSR